MSDDAAAAPAEECKCEKGAPKWVVTFGDMMSLLLTFFVLLLSFSTTDIVKYKKMVGSVKEAFGVATVSPTDTVPRGKRVITKQITLPNVFATLVTVRAKATRASKSSSELEMENGADWVRLKLDGDTVFDRGSWTIKPEAADVLAEIATLVREFEGVVAVEGHTDGTGPSQSVFEDGSYLGAYELGMMRAISVTSYLTDVLNVPPRKLAPTSWGDTRPRETNDLEEGRRRNRRVEFEFRTADGDAVRESGGEVIRAR